MTYQKKIVSEKEIALEVEGSLTGPEAEDFQAALEEVSSDSSLSTLTLNLTETTAINSASIGRILLAQRKLEETGAFLQIDGCSDAVYETLTSINLHKVVTIRP